MCNFFLPGDVQCGLFGLNDGRAAANSDKYSKGPENNYIFACEKNDLGTAGRILNSNHQSISVECGESLRRAVINKIRS